MGQSGKLKEILELEIVSGELEPGARLDEPSLGKRFGVSRTPVREALNQLAAVGLVQLRPSRSPVVATLTFQNLIEGFELMTELEGMCGRLAADRATAEERIAIERVHAEIAAIDLTTNSATADFYDRDTVFHELIYGAAHNDLLRDQIYRLRRRFAPYRQRHFKRHGRMTLSLAEHTGILEAILERDSARAAQALRDHVNMNGDVMADFLRDLNLPVGIHNRLDGATD